MHGYTDAVTNGRHPTLADVAVRAQVSLATASRVLNGSSRQVSPVLRQRVMAVAEDLRYRANPHAQAVARGASRLVGLVVHDISDPYFAAITAGVMRAAAARGLVVVLGTTNRDPAAELDYVATLGAQRVRALIVAGSRHRQRQHTDRLAEELSRFRAAGGSVACVSQPRLPAHTVVPQNRAAARALASALAELGHRHFAVLAGPGELVTVRDRIEGFRAGLAAAGLRLPADAVLHGDFTRDGGYAAAVALLDRGIPCTCVFAVTDVMAVGAMAAFRDRGTQVPESLSLAGFDDISMLRDLVPRLTTVRLPLEQMGERAVELALDTDPDAPPVIQQVTGEVVLRESTREPGGVRDGGRPAGHAASHRPRLSATKSVSTRSG